MNIVIPTDRKFLCQHRNGSTFATNPTTDYVSYWQGDMMEKFKLIETLEVSTITEAATTILINATVSGSNVTMVHPYNTWSDEGFVVGNTILIEVGALTSTGTITAINGLSMIFTDATFVADLGITSGVERDDYVIKSTTVPTSLIYKFGIIPNSTSPANYNSLLTGEVQAYAANSVGATLTDINYLGSAQSDLGTVQCKYDGASGSGNYIFTFTVEHVFQSPFFTPPWVVNYVNETIPADFQGSSSYKHVSEFNFGVNINNPNDGKIFQDDFQMGSVGFINQNFNTGSTNYTLDSFTYPNSELSIDALNDTDIEIVIKKNNGNWAAGERAYIYHTKFADQNDYSSDGVSIGTYEEIFILSSGTNIDGAGVSTQGVFTDLLVAIDGADPTLLNISATIHYTNPQRLLIDQGDQFFIGVGVEDSSLSATLSDRVIVWTEQNEWIKSPDVNELISDNQIDFYVPGMEIGVATPETGFYTWNNRITQMTGTFKLAKAINSDYALLEGLKIQIVAYNTTSGLFFKLNEYVFQMGRLVAIDVDGTLYQAMHINDINTIGVPSSSEINEATLEAESAPGSYQATQRFDWTLSLEISWRQWIENAEVLNVAPEFYANLPAEFDNYNERTSNYSNLEGYDIYVFATADVNSDGIITQYNMYSDLCKVADFDVDALGTGWAAVTEYYDESDNLITSFPLGQDVRVQVTIDNPGALLTAADILAEIVIEVGGSNGRDYRLHNTLDWDEPNNYLEPLAGETYVKVTQSAGAPNTVVLQALIKKEKIQLAGSDDTFNTYGHLYSKK